MTEFFDNVLEGNQMKEVVKVPLEKSGYLVLPYGYESTLSGLRRRLCEKGTRKSRTVRRVMASPDLLVYDAFLHFRTPKLVRHWFTVYPLSPRIRHF